MTIQLIKDTTGSNVKVTGTATPSLAINTYQVRIEDNDFITIEDTNSPNHDGGFNKIMSRIPYNLFTKSDGGIPISALDLKADMDIQFSEVANTDINAGYFGVWDASTNIPNLSAQNPNNGDWYFVSVSGNYNPNTGELDDQTFENENYLVNEIVKWNGVAWDQIPDLSIRVGDIESSAIDQFDWHVDESSRNSIGTGSAILPFKSIEEAIAVASDGDRILLKGMYYLDNGTIILPNNKSLSFFGTNGTTILFDGFLNTNGNLFSQPSISNNKIYNFTNLIFNYAGEYALNFKSAGEVHIKDCTFENNGWSGNGINTISPTNGSILGFDSDLVDLQNFANSVEISDIHNSGAIYIEKSPVFTLNNSIIKNNTIGLKLIDVGLSGYGYLLNNRIFTNIGTGIELLSSSGNSNTGCANFTIYNNAVNFNAGSGISNVGGFNNILALNTLNANWNHGVLSSYSSNYTVRDNYIVDNVRNSTNAFGEPINEDSNISITGSDININASFMISLLNNQIIDTDMPNNSGGKIGIYLSDNLDNINDRSRSKITIDNNIIQNQDIGEYIGCNLDTVMLVKGDSTFSGMISNDLVKVGQGSYFEMPYSNQHTRANTLDFSLDDTGSNIIIKETPAGDVINFYPINQLKAVSFGTKMRIMVHDSAKIQFDDVPISGITISGIHVNPILSVAVDDLNGIFSQTLGFVTVPSAYPLSGILDNNVITITMSDGTTFGIDVSPLDDNINVTDVVLVNDILTVTLSDLSEIETDLSELGIDTNVYATSGSLNITNDLLTLTLSDGSNFDIDVSALNIDTNVYLNNSTLTDNNDTLNLFLSDGTSVVQDVSALNIDTNTTVVSGVVSGDNLTLTMNDTSTVVIDVTTLTVDTNNEVVSGSVAGDTLTLTLTDGSNIDIDVTYLNNGSASTSVHKPEISDIILNTTELFNVNHTFTLDNDSLATMWAFDNIPNWLVPNYTNGNIMGAAPIHNGVSDTYNFTVNAANPFGIDSANVTINVNENLLSTTWNKGLDFDGSSDYCKIKKGTDVVNPLRRNLNGDGREWTVSSTFTRHTISGTHTIWSQSDTTVNNPRIYLQMIDNKLLFRYGTTNNYLQWEHESFFDNSYSGDWFNIVLSFDGGTTGDLAGPINNYYSRFKIYKVGVDNGIAVEITNDGTWTQDNFGFINAINGVFYVGSLYTTTDEWLGRIAATSVTNLEISDIDEVGQFAFDPVGWANDPTNIHGNILNTETDANTTHIWLMGDGLTDAFSIIYNQVFPDNSDTRLDMVNMSANDIINVNI